VTHGNPITDTNNTEFERHAPGGCYPFPDFLGQLPQVDMAGNYGIECICNADEREIHLTIRNPEGPEE
jgi:hypothetical protein